MLTMTTLFGVVGKINDITDSMLKALGWSKDKITDMLTDTKTTSLTQQVSGVINVFPVVITGDIPTHAATLIMEMTEIEMANYMTFALANSPKISIHDVNNGKYLKDYHTNLNALESVLEGAFDADSEVDSALASSLIDSVLENNVIVRPTVRNQLMQKMQEAMTPENNFYGLEWLMEGDQRDHTSDIGSVTNLGLNVAKTASSEIRNWKKYADDNAAQKRREQREEEQTVDSHVARNFDKMYSFKKLNEMQPVPVVAHIFTVDNNGTPSRQIEVVCGVKAKLHPINKKEFLSLMKSEDNGDMLTDIIRFATGELHFFKDLLIGTNGIKEYAAKSGRYSSTGAKVLATLKRVQELNRKGKGLKPNATLVVSKAAVDELKRIHGIDLLDEDDAKTICDRLSLIKLIVSDNVGGKLHIFMPGFHDTFSVISTDALEKQIDATQDANMTKELRKVLSKGA